MLFKAKLSNYRFGLNKCVAHSKWGFQSDLWLAKGKAKYLKLLFLCKIKRMSVFLSVRLAMDLTNH